jgi:rhodanese-related sulfurtransferase
MRKYTLLIVLLSIALAIVSKSPAEPDIKTIDTAGLHSMVVDNAYMLEKGQEPQSIIIDARTKEEFDKTHIFSAISIPEKDLPKSIGRLPKDKNVLLVVYCSGIQSDTSIKWAGKATAAGYTNINTYSEGFSVWREKKMPIAPLRNGI